MKSIYNRLEDEPEPPFSEEHKERIRNQYDRLVSQLRDLETPKYRIIERLKKQLPPSYIDTEKCVFKTNIIEKHIQELKGETPAKENKYNGKELFYLLHKLGFIDYLYDNKGVKRQSDKGHKQLAKIIEAITGREMNPNTVKSYQSEIKGKSIPKTTKRKMDDVYTELME